ncbi:MAG: glycosyltransferase family 39 protein [Anaerolineae bacterium]|nr:glycosyltransferase family 39 protein [Anaerolineae bacterium]MDW8071275.1 glycosyltransferase family 39 protein [Anaerolineae bacterium]
MGGCASIAAFLTVTNLGYADHWGDEMNGLLRALAVVNGRSEALFAHTKGPGEVLVPAAFGLLAGSWDPFTMRLPFALAHIAGTVTLYLLARTMFNRSVAVLTALLIAIDGLYVAFGRLVQYQALVFLITTLALWFAFHYYRYGNAWHLIGMAFLGSIGLLAHYDALVVVPVLAFLVGRRLVEHPAELRTHYRLLMGAVLLAAGMAALFYFPYLHYPRVSETATYLGRRIIGVTKWPANNFGELYVFNVLYNSVYYVAFLGAAVLLKAGYDLITAAGERARRGRAIGVVIGLILAILIAYATRLQRYLPLVAVCLGLGYLLTAPNIATAPKAVYIWVASAFLGYVFFVYHPCTHLQMILPGATVLAGLGVVQALGALRARLCFCGSVRFWFVPTGLGALLLLLFANYQFTLFVDTRTEYVSPIRGTKIPSIGRIRAFLSAHAGPMVCPTAWVGR